jgi:hypothetical protein
MYELHRLRITGPLDPLETPIDVVRCCLESHGIEPVYSLEDGRYRKKCIDRLTECKPVRISSKKDYGRAVRYINSHTIFESESTIEAALDHLHRWERQTSSGEFGPVTEQTPQAIDITMLYKLCRQRSLRTSSDMKFDDLKRLYHLSELPLDQLRDMITDRIQVTQIAELSNMAYSMNLSRETSVYDMYLESRNIQHHLHDPLHVKFPKTRHEAVLMAAFNFKRDISSSADPMKEYAVLMKDQKYFPVDNYLTHLQTTDRYALCLDQRFNPELPKYVYQPDDLIRMATEEGWISSMEIEPCTFLRDNYMKNTFFAYKKGPMISVEPENSELVVEAQPISELAQSGIVLYGKRGDQSHMVAFSWSELTSSFDHYKEFRNPASDPPDVFPEHVVRKLVILARKPCAEEDVSRTRKALISSVERIFLEKRLLNEKIRNIQSKITREPSLRESAEHILERLYEISQVMRAGTEDSQYAAAIDIYNFLSDPETTQSDILGLPLVIYYPRSGSFSTSESAYEGYTIRGRLQIVQEGETTRAISSCMRLSSNWFLSTVYYYQVAFGFDPSFNIIDLVHVS